MNIETIDQNMDRMFLAWKIDPNTRAKIKKLVYAHGEAIRAVVPGISALDVRTSQVNFCAGVVAGMRLAKEGHI